jgi:sugar transferase (PEP-CTERM/EpsH1 system associated)
MRILVLTPQFPWPLTGGGHVRNFNLLFQTAKHHEVTLLSFLFPDTTPEDMEEMRKHCAHVEGVRIPLGMVPMVRATLRSLLTPHPMITSKYDIPEMHAALKRLTRERSIDIIHAHFLHVGQYSGSKTTAAFVYDAHNLDHRLWQRFVRHTQNPFKRLAGRREIGKLEWIQRRIAGEAEKIVTLSPEDQVEYQRLAPEADVSVVPNGADLEYYAPRPDEPEPGSIIYTGRMNWPPNVDAATYFAREIFPLVREREKQARFYIVGYEPPRSVRELEGEGVIVTGTVPDVRDYLARAMVFVAPIRIGAGTKHKILHALSMKKPLVVTPIAAEGMGLIHNETALVAETPRAFADSVVRLFHDPELYERLIRNGRRFVEEHHDWSAIYRRLEQVYGEANEKRQCWSHGS